MKPQLQFLVTSLALLMVALAALSHAFNLRRLNAEVRDLTEQVRAMGEAAKPQPASRDSAGSYCVGAALARGEAIRLEADGTVEGRAQAEELRFMAEQLCRDKR